MMFSFLSYRIAYEERTGAVWFQWLHTIKNAPRGGEGK